MNGFDVDPAVLTTVSGKLSSAASLVDGAPAAPPPPQAGDCTAVVNNVLALLCRDTDSLAAGLQAASGEVTNTLLEYQTRDQAEASAFEGRS